LWPFVADRRVLWAMAAMVTMVVVQYAVYVLIDTWWFRRYWLPVWPFLALGVGSLALAGARHRRAGVALASVWLVVLLGVYNFRATEKLGTFQEWVGDRAVPAVAHAVRDHTDDRSMVLTLIHSGPLRYYGGRMTLRFDALDREWLDRAVAWLGERGVRVYALLEPWEVSQFEGQFAGQRAAADLSRRAVFFYRGVNAIGLYDLTPGATLAPRDIVATDPAALRAVSPAPPPALTLR
jgi:hypothetical protein